MGPPRLGHAADGMAMVTSVVRVQQLLMERIDAVLRPLDLTFARYEVLRLLSFVPSGSMPMTRLGSLLQVHPTSVTSAVERLVEQGYVERLRREEDRRVILAALTAAGRDVVERATLGLNGRCSRPPALRPPTSCGSPSCSARCARRPATTSLPPATSR